MVIGGNTESEEFRELIVRWFQYGVFCPVLRLHGNRDGHDRTRDIIEPTGGDNELWSFGERNFEILTKLVLLRERQDKSVYEGPGFYTLSAGISEFIAFVKDGAEIIKAFDAGETTGAGLCKTDMSAPVPAII